MDDPKRLKTKMAVATAVSNMELLTKIPGGRIDYLTDNFMAWPNEFAVAVANPHTCPKKGSKDWRICRDYIVELKLTTKERKAREPREPKERQPKARAWIDQYGMINFKPRFISQLKAAGRDYAKDCREQLEGPEGGDICGPAWDIAEGMLMSEGLEPGQRGFNKLKEAAGDYVADGIQRVIG